MNLYPWLDPLWDKTPFPYKTWTQEGKEHGIRYLRVGRAYGKQPILSVYVYLFEDTMIDTGCPGLGKEIWQWAQQKKIKKPKALLTHHHEDHSGNAAYLQKKGWEIWSGSKTKKILSQSTSIKFYQHMVWGKYHPCSTKILPKTISIGNSEAKIISVPGHCLDQIAFYLPERGWLFSADAFVHEKVKYFRSDESFQQSLDTLEKLCQLDFDVLLCAHGPRWKNGKKSLEKKLNWFREIEEKTQELHHKGLSLGEITQKIFPRSSRFLSYFSGGDVSSKNIIKSILYGSQERPQIEAILRSEE